MSIGSVEGLLHEVYRVAQADAESQGVYLKAGHVLSAVRQVMPYVPSGAHSDIAVFEYAIGIIRSLNDRQLKKPEIEAVVTALKRWENLTKTSKETQSVVRTVASKFFYVPPLHAGNERK